MAERTRVLVEGTARGTALVLEQPLSFWGGLDPETGRIIDQRHPQRGVDVAGTVLVMESGRGSSSASSVLTEAARRGTAPVAVVMVEADEIVALGSIVAQELYGTTIPVVVLPPEAYAELTTGVEVVVDGASVGVAGG